MKKILTLIAILLSYFLFPIPSSAIALADGQQYACILSDDVYFYTAESEASGIFLLPETYYVRILSVGKPYTKIEYLTDGEHTRRLIGYCRTDKLTFVDYTPLNPYLYATFDVVYTVDGGETEDALVNKLSLTCGYYGKYSIGSKQYAYVLQNGEFAYVPMPKNFTYPKNAEHASRTDQGEEFSTEEKTDGIQIAVLAVLCLIVPLLAAVILKTSKKLPYDLDE